MILLPAPFAQVPAPTPQERAAVAAFLREAHIGLDPNVVLPPYERMGEPRIDDSELVRWGVRGKRRYGYDYGDLTVNPAVGRIVTYANAWSAGYGPPVHNPDGSVVPRRVTNEDAAAIARRIYRAAGNPETIRVEEVADLMGGNETCVQVRFVPTLGGVPLDQGYEDTMDLDRQTGQVCSFGCAIDVPLRPATLRPSGSTADARLVALRAALARRPGATARVWPDSFDLRIWLPPERSAREPNFVGREPDPRVRAAIVARRGILAYAGKVLYRPGLSVDMVIEAHTGEVLRFEVQDWVEIMKRTGGGAPLPPSKPLTMPTAARPWRLATGKAGWSAWTAPVRAALAPAKAAGPLPKARLTITDGEAAFRVAYDPRRNLLALVRPDETVLAYTPGPALAALLRKRTKG